MNHLLTCILILLLSGTPVSGDETPWYRIMTDLGSPERGWVISSSRENTLRKTFSLDFPASEIRKSAVEYEIAEDPYDRVQKMRIKGKADNLRHAWSHIQIRVNGKVVVDEPAGAYIYKGVHQVEIPSDALHTGENVIELGWGEKRPERVGGYIYFAVDLTEAEKQRRTIPPKDRPAPDPQSLRVRLLMQF